jgi:hypothetical protein
MKVTHLSSARSWALRTEITEREGMSLMGEPHRPAGDHLSKLGVELSARGMKCELVTTGWVPRLRLEIPWGWASGRFADSAFEDHVVAADFGDGRWRFWWPWIEPIAPVDDLEGAANHILRNTLEVTTPETGDERGGVLAQAVSAGGQHGSCGSCMLLHGLATDLQTRGLHVRSLSYRGTPAGGGERIEDIELTNPASPGSGMMRVGHDGSVVWEYRRKLDSRHDTREIAFIITAMLGVPLRPGPAASR